MIHTYIPFSPSEKKLNLGWVYNNFMEIVGEEDWVLFLDYDATFTTKYWYNQLEDIIKKNTDYGLFSSFMNRVGQPFQIPNGIDRNNHDMRYHRNVGKELQNINYDNVIQFPNNTPLSGVVILISKKTWKDIGGFKEGFLGVDNTLHRDCINNNIKVGLMSGFYVYHWYRADGDMSHINESNKLHKNPYF